MRRAVQSAIADLLVSLIRRNDIAHWSLRFLLPRRHVVEFCVSSLFNATRILYNSFRQRFKFELWRTTVCLWHFLRISLAPSSEWRHNSSRGSFASCYFNRRNFVAIAPATCSPDEVSANWSQTVCLLYHVLESTMVSIMSIWCLAQLVIYGPICK